MMVVEKRRTYFFRKLQTVIRRVGAVLFRQHIIKRMRVSNRIEKCSIIASNCIGGLLYHDLRMRFDTPTINLFFTAHDFVVFLSDLKKYLSITPSDFRLSSDDGKGYPVGKLDDIELHFVHYKTVEECVLKWEERKKRIDFDNLYVIFTDRNGLTLEDLKAFLSMDYRKIVYVSKKQFCLSEECIYIPGFEKAESVPEMQRYADVFGHRYYEKYYDVVKWLNEKK